MAISEDKPNLTLTFLVVHLEKETVNRYRYFYKLTVGNNCFTKNDSERIFADGYLLSEYALKNGFKKVDSRQNYILSNIINKFNDIQDILIEDKLFPEWLSFEGISLWQFITGVMYDGPPQEVIELIEYLSGLITETEPKYLRVMGPLSEHQKKTCRQIAQYFNTPVFFQEDKKGKGNNKLKVLIMNVIYKSKHIVESSIHRSKDWQIEAGNRSSIRDYALSFENNIDNKKIALMVSYPKEWIRKDGGDIDRIYNAFKGFLQNNNLEGVRIELPYYYQIRGSKKKYIESVKAAKRGGFITILLDEYYSDQMVKEMTKWKNHFEGIFAILERNENLLRAFSWRGISFIVPLYEYWKYLFTDFLVYECINSILLARIMLRKLKPEIVFVLYEVGHYSRAIIIEAQRVGIQSVGLQHGFCFKEQQYYLHKNQSTKPDFEKGFYGFIAPNKTLVYSEYARKVLTIDGHYPKDSVVVVGDWKYLNNRFADLKESALLFKREWFLIGKQIALVLTSAFATGLAQSLVRKLNPNSYSILVKLHPDDLNQDYYEDIFTRNKFEVRIVRDYLFEAIQMADIIFAPIYTTVILDCLALNKPIFYFKEFDTGVTIPYEEFIMDMENIKDFEQEVPTLSKYDVDSALKKFGVDMNISENEFTQNLTDILV